MSHADNNARRERLGRMAGVALITFSIFNGLALAFGLYGALADQIFVSRLILSVMGGITVATMIAVGWRMLMQSAIAGLRDIPTAALGAILALVGIIVSAWFLASLIGGDEAHQDYQSDHLVVLQGQANRISGNARLDANVVAATRTASVEVEQMAQAEAANGLISRIGRGRAEWARTLEAFAATLQARATAMETLQERREDRLTLFGRTLAEARLAASRGQNERYEDLVTRGARLLAEADGIANHATVGGIGTGLMAQEARAQIGQTMTRLREVADTAGTQWRSEDIPFYRPVSKQVATALSADAIPGAWAVAVAFELFPLIMLLIVLHRPEDPEPAQQSENDNEPREAGSASASLRNAA